MKHYLFALLINLFCIGTLLAQDQKTYSSNANKEYENGNYTTAIELYSKAISIEPQGYDYWSRGNCYYSINEMQKAKADFLKAITYYSNDKESLATLNFYVGLACFYLNDPSGAIEYLTKSSEYEPNRGSLYEYRAYSYNSLDENNKALDDFAKAISLFQGDNSKIAKLYELRGFTKTTKLKDYLGALEEYDRAISYNSNNVLLYIYRSKVNWLLKNYNKAFDDIGAAINYYAKDSSSLLDAYIQRAYYNFELKKISDALEDYNMAIRCSPSSAKAYESRASFYIKTADFKSATADYTKCIYLIEKKNLNPFVYYYERGKNYRFNLNEPTLASADFQKVIELCPNKESSLYAFTIAFMGDPVQGIAVLEGAIAKSTNKKNGGKYYDLACLHSLLCHEKEAINALDIALQNGYNNYNSIMKDRDFDNIKYKPAFKNLLQKYSIPYEIKIENISEVIKGEVRMALAQWQEKGEFETNQQYIERMKQRDAIVSNLTEKTIEKFKKIHADDANLNNFTIAKYDSESQTFKITYNTTGDIVIIKVPLAEAPLFKENQSKLKFIRPNFIIQNNEWVLSYLDIQNPINGKIYNYDITKQASYDPTSKFILNYDDVKIDIPNQTVAINQNTSTQTNKKVILGRPEVDTNIPVSQTQKTNTYCLIIGNEDYSSYQTGLSTEVNVAFAVNDAKVFKEYCNKTLGIPEKQIKLLPNATIGQMNQGIAWLCNLAKIDNGKAELIFYYSGHGLPDEQTKEPYLIPVDISGSNVNQGVKLADVFSKLNEFPSKKIVVFLDACFSGGARNQGLITMKGVKVKPKENIVAGNMIIISSSTGEESSGVYNEMQHGYMTYFLLKKLQETKGEINYKDFAEYIIECVKKETALNGKIQTPQLNFSPSVEGQLVNWNVK